MGQARHPDIYVAWLELHRLTQTTVNLLPYDV